MEVAVGGYIFINANGLQHTVSMLKTWVWSEEIKYCCISCKKGWMLGAKTFSW